MFANNNVAIFLQRSFLLQLGGHNLKIVIKHIIRRVYSLQLQGKVNYTGREGKRGMSSLQQTKIIIGKKSQKIISK